MSTSRYYPSRRGRLSRMKTFRISRALLTAAVICAAAGSMVIAQRRGAPAPATSGVLTRTIAAANTFLGLLDETQRAKAQFPSSHWALLCI